MDIICASCGKHFNSIESAREHRYHCKGAKNGEALHWISSDKDELTPEQKERLQKLLDSINEPHESVETSQNWQATSIAEKPSPPPKSGHAFSPQHKKSYTSKPKKPHKPMSRNTKGFILSVTLALALSLIGLGAYLYTGNPVPMYLLLGFSVIFSMEMWFRHLTSKHKSISIIYRIVVNISILALLIHIVWSGVQLFSGESNQNAVVQSVIFIFEFGLFVWLFTVLIKNSWRSPSLKLTIVALCLVFLVFTFAGVQPMTEYKDKSLVFMESIVENVKEYFQGDELGSNSNIGQNPSTTPSNTDTIPNTTTNTKTTAATTTTVPRTTTVVDGINFSTGTYTNYFLGLIKGSDGVSAGNDCYGEFIVLINNQNAKNPTYAGLIDFLRSDDTDEYPYLFTISAGLSFYGSPESHMDLGRLKNIINGIEEPRDPRVCADFAERLHNNAEKAGIRCGYISLDFDDGVGHACNVFETTDRGIVYVDDTGISTWGPSNCDKIVDIKIGNQYIPKSLFPEPGWSSVWEDMGIVTSMVVTWDGAWN